MSSQEQLGGTDGDAVTLSTGHRVDLPLSTEATITGVVRSADREGVDELLPTGLEPIRATPTRAAVTFLCVEYHRIGHDSGIEPYNEFGVLLPAVPTGTRTVPYHSVLTRGVSGYVWYLPVTTEPARALGVDIWGYPKVVADISHEDQGDTRRTTVSVDGDRLVDVAIDRPPQPLRSDTGESYTVRDGHLLRERLELRGRLGVWPYSDRVSVTLGDHPRARRLAALDLGERALLRAAVDGEFVIHAGEFVGRV